MAQRCHLAHYTSCVMENRVHHLAGELGTSSNSLKKNSFKELELM